jgi:hypothetical protein
MVSYKD